MLKLKILLAEDMAHERLVIETRLKATLAPQIEAVFTSVDNAEEACVYTRTDSFDLVILDLDFSHSPKSKGMDGLSAAKKIKTQKPETRVVVVSSNEEEATMREAVDACSVDWYLRRSSISYDELAWQARQGLLSRLHREGMLVEEKYRFLTENQQAKQILTRVDAVLPQQNILIYGETGTGKELIARRIHANAKAFDPKRPLRILDCSTLSPQLFESEVFGHRKGAFTGANHDRAGALELVNGGDLFLDEIHNIPIHLQQKLLRVLNDGVFSPLGSNSELKSRFRVIAATNIPIADAIKGGKLLADFVARIQRIQIELLPLRERKKDIPFLISTLLEKSGVDKEFSPEALAYMETLKWLGNIRELQGAVEKIVNETKTPIVSSDCVIRALGTKEQVPANQSSLESLAEHLISAGIPIEQSINDLKRLYLSKGMSRLSIERLAQINSVHRSTIHRQLKDLEII